MRLSIYRYDPDKDARPYMKDYDVPLEPWTGCCSMCW